MKITDIIAESFDSDVKGKIVKAGPGYFHTKADIGTRTILFSAAASPAGENQWEIEFLENTKKGQTFTKSGSGNEMQVFSFVIESIKEFVARYHPEVITFNSHKADQNRSKLYARMMRRVSSVLPGYSEAPVSSTDSSDTFTIVKDK